MPDAEDPGGGGVATWNESGFWRGIAGAHADSDNFERMDSVSEPLDDQLAQLEAKVQNSLKGSVRGLHLAVRDCGLVLYGQAFSYYAKQLAQHAVMRAGVLPIVANEIHVLHQADEFNPRAPSTPIIEVRFS